MLWYNTCFKVCQSKTYCGNSCCHFCLCCIQWFFQNRIGLSNDSLNMYSLAGNFPVLHYQISSQAVFSLKNVGWLTVTSYGANKSCTLKPLSVISENYITMVTHSQKVRSFYNLHISIVEPSDAQDTMPPGRHQPTPSRYFCSYRC